MLSLEFPFAANIKAQDTVLFETSPETLSLHPFLSRDICPLIVPPPSEQLRRVDTGSPEDPGFRAHPLVGVCRNARDLHAFVS